MLVPAAPGGGCAQGEGHLEPKAPLSQRMSMSTGTKLPPTMPPMQPASQPRLVARLALAARLELLLELGHLHGHQVLVGHI